MLDENNLMIFILSEMCDLGSLNERAIDASSDTTTQEYMYASKAELNRCGVEADVFVYSNQIRVHEACIYETEYAISCRLSSLLYFLPATMLNILSGMCVSGEPTTSLLAVVSWVKSKFVLLRVA